MSGRGRRNSGRKSQRGAPQQWAPRRAGSNDQLAGSSDAAAPRAVADASAATQAAEAAPTQAAPGAAPAAQASSPRAAAAPGEGVTSQSPARGAASPPASAAGTAAVTAASAPLVANTAVAPAADSSAASAAAAAPSTVDAVAAPLTPAPAAASPPRPAAAPSAAVPAVASPRAAAATPAAAAAATTSPRAAAATPAAAPAVASPRAAVSQAAATPAAAAAATASPRAAAATPAAAPAVASPRTAAATPAAAAAATASSPQAVDARAAAAGVGPAASESLASGGAEQPLEPSEHAAEINAATRIQAVYRGFITRRKSVIEVTRPTFTSQTRAELGQLQRDQARLKMEESERLRLSARSAGRGFPLTPPNGSQPSTPRAAKAAEAEQQASATLIQKVYRGHRTRGHLAAERRRVGAEAPVVAADAGQGEAADGAAAPDAAAAAAAPSPSTEAPAPPTEPAAPAAEDEDAARRAAAAVTIQQTFRGHLAREQLRLDAEDAELAAAAAVAVVRAAQPSSEDLTDAVAGRGQSAPAARGDVHLQPVPPTAYSTRTASDATLRPPGSLIKLHLEAAVSGKPIVVTSHPDSYARAPATEPAWGVPPSEDAKAKQERIRKYAFVTSVLHRADLSPKHRLSPLALRTPSPEPRAQSTPRAVQVPVEPPPGVDAQQFLEEQLERAKADRLRVAQLRVERAQRHAKLEEERLRHEAEVQRAEEQAQEALRQAQLQKELERIRRREERSRRQYLRELEAQKEREMLAAAQQLVAKHADGDPLYLKLQRKYQEEVLAPQLQRQSTELSQRAALNAPLDFPALRRHADDFETRAAARRERLEHERRTRERSPDPGLYHGKAFDRMVDEERQRRELQRQAEEAHALGARRKAEYAARVREEFVPRADPGKAAELEKLRRRYHTEPRESRRITGHVPIGAPSARPAASAEAEDSGDGSPSRGRSPERERSRPRPPARASPSPPPRRRLPNYLAELRAQRGSELPKVVRERSEDRLARLERRARDAERAAQARERRQANQPPLSPQPPEDGDPDDLYLDAIRAKMELLEQV